jgi:signal transduction histidine kinase
MPLTSLQNTALIRKVFLLSFFLFSFFNLNSQITQKDSLTKKIKDFVKLPNNEKHTKEYVDLLTELSRLHRFSNPDSLKILSAEALEISKKIAYMDGEILATIYQGDYFSDTGKSKEGQKTYEQAEEKLNKNYNPKLKVTLLNSISLNFLFREKLRDGFKTLYEAINIAKENSFIETEARLRHNLGFIYWTNQLYDEAESEYMVADSLWRSSGNTVFLALTESNIALNSLDNGNLEQSKVYLDKSISTLVKTDDILWLSRTYRVKAEYFIARKDYKRASLWIYKSDSLTSLIDNSRDKLLTYKTYAEISFRKEDWKMTNEYALKLLELAKAFNNQKAIHKSYSFLKEVEYSRGNWEKMIVYQKILDSLQRHLDTTNSIKSLKFLRAKLEYEKDQLKINQENEKKLSRQKAINRIIVIALLIILIIGSLVRKNSLNQKKANKKLKEINETKDKIFSIIGHDLKTPLNTLNELLELVKEKNISPTEMIELTPQIQTNIDYSTFSLNNLLCWAQSEMGGIIANPSKLNITNIINETVLVFEPKATNKNIQIKSNISEKIIGKFDNEHLRIIFRNILCNAIKFTSNNGQIIINSQIEPNQIEISVCDNGIGYNPDDFNNLKNGKPTKSTRGTNDEKGTGLGLTICKELLDKNNSRLKIKHNKPNGSCFTVIIPV